MHKYYLAEVIHIFLITRLLHHGPSLLWKSVGNVVQVKLAILLAILGEMTYHENQSVPFLFHLGDNSRYSRPSPQQFLQISAGFSGQAEAGWPSCEQIRQAPLNTHGLGHSALLCLG